MGTTHLAVFPGPATFRETVLFRGHPLVSSKHPTTIEVTTEDSLTSNGDCIIGVSASSGCAQLGASLKRALMARSAKVRIGIGAGHETFVFEARGDPGLTLSHEHDIVIRKSGFLSDRTAAVSANAAARDIPRELVDQLRNPNTVGSLVIEVV